MRRNLSFFHRLALALLPLALWLPASALAVGLGKLTVFSGLGQPLSAEIELVSIEKSELDSLNVRVADAGSYRDARVEYQPVLSRVKIVVDKRKDGTAVLKITSLGAVNDPFLDLLLEINWAAGRLTREYTFLLDPPDFGNKGVAQAAQAAGPVVGQALPAAPAAKARAPEVAAPVAGGSYGPIKSGETLGKIANKVKPEGVTLDQMLIALFQANQSAFVGNNIHRLRTGETLTVPGKEDVAAIAGNDAAKLVRIQTADWHAYRDRLTASVPSTGESGASSAGKITPMAEDKGKGQVDPGRDQLRLSKGQAAGAKAGGQSAQEDATARGKALSEANSRVSDLEKQVRDLQQLLTLKNQALSELQQQSKGAAAPKAEAKTAPPAPTPPAQVATAPVQSVAPLEPPKAQAPTPAPENAAPVPPPEAKPVAEPPKPAPAVEAKTKPVVAAQPERSFYDDWINPYTIAAGGGLIGLIGIWALLATRRKRATRGFEDSIMTGTDIKTNTVFGNTGGGVVNTGDNSMTTGFSRQGLGNIDTDEVDPIAEAEVYLAYGRDAQAEEILRDALQKDPQRHEIYLKLLEIQAHNNRRDAFESIAGELYTATRGEGEIWQRAATMGRQLDPNNPMYAEATEHPSDIPTAPLFGRTEPGEPMGTVKLENTQSVKPPLEETQVFTIRPALTPEPAKSSPGALDFSLDELSTRPGVVQPSLEPADEEKAEPPILEWDAPKFTPPPVQPTHATTASNEVWSGGSATVETPVQAPRPAPVLTAVETAKVTPLHEAKPAVGLDLDKLDLSFDPQRAPVEDPTPSVLDGQWHDAATKLDLARAYQEMGDLEGAREILQEVLHEGDPDQKREAQTLLDKLRAA